MATPLTPIRTMTKAEMTNRFSSLFSIMKSGKKVENMKIFGKVMCDMMSDLIETHPEKAEELIEKLCAVQWNNYLTKQEAEHILAKMSPGMRWDLDSFCNIVNELGGTTEHSPCYNKYALWVAMNMVFSDSAQSIASIMGRSIETIPETQIANAVYLLATDKLHDEDGVFNIRHYFTI